MKKNLVITIDGPAGAGKSTVSKTIGKEAELYLSGYRRSLSGYGL